MHHKTFSIVIPAYNAATTIAKSIASALAQTHPPLEIIIVDDSSTDHTVTVIQNMIAAHQSPTELILIQQPYNQGPANARNKGWDAAKGDFVCFLDSDDQFNTRKLEYLNEYWPLDAMVVINGFNHDTAENISLPKELQPVSAFSIIKSNPAQGSSISVRKVFSHQFPKDQYYAEDLEFALIAIQYGKVVKTAAILTFTSRPQLSAGGLSSNHWKMRKGELRAFTTLSKCHIKWLIALPLLYSWSMMKHLIKKLL